MVMKMPQNNKKTKQNKLVVSMQNSGMCLWTRFICNRFVSLNNEFGILVAYPEFPVMVSILPFQEKKSQLLKLISSVAFVGLKESRLCASHKTYMIFCEGGMSAAPTLV